MRWPKRPALRRCQTVYYTFGTKAALLAESMGAAIVGFDPGVSPAGAPTFDIVQFLPWHQWWADFEAAPASRPTPSTSSSLTVSASSNRSGPLVAALHGASGRRRGSRGAGYRREGTSGGLLPGGSPLRHRRQARRPLSRGLSLAGGLPTSSLCCSAPSYTKHSRSGADGRTHHCINFFRQMLTALLLDDGR